MSSETVILNSSNPTATVTITTNSTGAISVVSSDISICTATVSGQSVVISATSRGTTSVTVNIAESDNFSSISKNISVDASNIAVDIHQISQIENFWTTNTDWNFYETVKQYRNLIKAGDYFDFKIVKDLTLRESSYPYAETRILPVGSTLRAVCLGVNHNSALEGNLAHFCVGRLADNSEIALYGRNYYVVEKEADSGWADSDIRTWLNNVFYDVLPKDLKECISACTKYTDNLHTTDFGSHEAVSNVTATSDNIWLMSEFEIFGVRKCANTNEQTKQQQYDYYKNGNSRIRRPHNDYNGLAVDWWTRSPSHIGGVCYVDTGGGAGTASSGNLHGIVPCFTL